MKINPIKAGKKAPAFTLLDKDGEKHRLTEIDTPYVVLFFYPKDNTPGCTIEAKGFSSMKKKFEKAGVTVIGISGGDEKSKTKFCSKHKITSLLLSDTEFKIATKYGVYGEKKFMGKTFDGIQRSTFVLDDKKKIIKVYEKVKPAEHPQEVLDFIAELEESAR